MPVPVVATETDVQESLERADALNTQNEGCCSFLVLAATKAESQASPRMAAQVWFCELCQERQPLASVHKLIIDEQTMKDIYVCGNCCDCEVWGPPCNPRDIAAESEKKETILDQANKKILLLEPAIEESTGLSKQLETVLQSDQSDRRKPVSEFSKRLARRQVKRNDGNARCNTCFDLEDAERQALQDVSVNVLKRSYARIAQEE